MGNTTVEFWRSIKNVSGITLALVSLFFGVLSFVLISAKTTIPAWWLVVAAGLWFYISLALLDFAIRAKQQTVNATPKIKTALNHSGRDSELMLVLEPSSLFGIGMAVSIYQVVKGVEILAASGYVSNIQNDKLVQIQVLTEGRQELRQTNWKDLHDDTDQLSRILIKPFAQHNYVQ